EAPGKHGLSQPLREATYAWFDRWLSGREREPAIEDAVIPRLAKDLRACPDGQVSVSFRSRPLLPLALEEFRARGKRPRRSLKDLVRPSPDGAAIRIAYTRAGTRAGAPLVLFVNGNEA